MPEQEQVDFFYVEASCLPVHETLNCLCRNYCSSARSPCASDLPRHESSGLLITKSSGLPIPKCSGLFIQGPKNTTTTRASCGSNTFGLSVSRISACMLYPIWLTAYKYAPSMGDSSEGPNRAHWAFSENRTHGPWVQIFGTLVSRDFLSK